MSRRLRVLQGQWHSIPKKESSVEYVQVLYILANLQLEQNRLLMYLGNQNCYHSKDLLQQHQSWLKTSISTADHDRRPNCAYDFRAFLLFAAFVETSCASMCLDDFLLS